MWCQRHMSVNDLPTVKWNSRKSNLPPLDQSPTFWQGTIILMLAAWRASDSDFLYHLYFSTRGWALDRVHNSHRPLDHLQCVFATLALTLTLTFDLWHAPSVYIGYPKIIPYTKFEHFGIIRFWIIVRTNKQNHRHTQTDADDRLTHATAVSVSNYVHFDIVIRAAGIPVTQR